MKVKNITIGVKDLKATLDESIEAINTIRKRQPLRFSKEEINFVSFEAARQFFTPKRIELLQLIHQRKPHSVYALARLARRDLKNIQADVELLARIGLVDLERETHSRACTVPRVVYDHLNLRLQIAI